MRALLEAAGRRWIAAHAALVCRNDAAGDADVVTLKIGLATEDVHEPLADAAHAPGHRRNRTIVKPGYCEKRIVP